MVSLFDGEGSECIFVLDEKMPDDTNLLVKVDGPIVEIHINPNRIYSTLSSKNMIIAAINKKLSELLAEFKAKIKFKKLEDSKYWDVILKDAVYEKLKHTDKFSYFDAEKILEATFRVLLDKKEAEENKRLKEMREIDNVQSKIDKGEINEKE